MKLFAYVSDVVLKYRDKIRKLESEIKEILKQEEEEKQLRVTEMEVNKARNLIEHEQEIFSRPKKTWIQTGKKRAAASIGNDNDWSVPLSKKRKREEIKAKMKNKQETVRLFFFVYCLAIKFRNFALSAGGESYKS